MSRVAIVTGGTRGIGEAISVGLKEAGYSVAATYAGNDEAAARFSEKTGIPAFKFDVADFEQCAAAVEKIAADLGPVEILVNNAGITRDGTLHRMSFDQWNSVIQTNLSSCFNMCRCVIDGMRERGFGRIVNITSSSVKSPIPTLGLSNGARAGLTGFVAGVARQVANRGVTINGILPGPFDTDRLRQGIRYIAEQAGRDFDTEFEERKKTNPAGRYGSPEEFGALCAFLCSAHAGYINGQNIVIDGGNYPGTL